MINENLRDSGSVFACRRFKEYRGHVYWLFHCKYFGVEICRAYHRDNQRPCALYAAEIDGSVLLVAENLDGIKKEVKKVMQ